jgi:osmotically inducible protein OsmC
MPASTGFAAGRLHVLLHCQHNHAEGNFMKRSASAKWSGDLKSGKGAISSVSGVFNDMPYSFKTRFEEAITGTNPEELIAAAHAGCFSMALSNDLASAGHTPESVETKADLTLDFVDGKPTITKIHLTVDASVPGIETGEFMTFAEGAKKNCPVSRVLNADITMTANLA